jgi:hypothetical protein
MSTSLDKAKRNLFLVIAIIGLIIFGSGIFVLILAIKNEISVIDLENSLFSSNLPRPIVDGPVFVWAAIFLFYFGCILCLFGGLVSRHKALVLPLIILGIIPLMELATLKIVPLYSPYYIQRSIALAEIISEFILILIFSFPGLICIFEGIYLIRIGKSIKY